MNRRDFLFALAALALMPAARAGELEGVSAGEVVQALRDGLTACAKAALARLGKENGYFANPQVKIGLPRNFRKADRILRSLGQGRKVDDLVLAMNRAAEMAVPKMEKALIDAIRRLPIHDAHGVLAAGDQSATAYFRKLTEAPLSAELLPLIKAVGEPSGLSRAYRSLAAKLEQLAGIKSDPETVEDYVCKKALEGMYTMIGAEERSLRANPSPYAGGPIGKVFGLLK